MLVVVVGGVGEVGVLVEFENWGGRKEFGGGEGRGGPSSVSLDRPS